MDGDGEEEPGGIGDDEFGAVEVHHTGDENDGEAEAGDESCGEDHPGAVFFDLMSCPEHAAGVEHAFNEFAMENGFAEIPADGVGDDVGDEDREVTGEPGVGEGSGFAFSEDAGGNNEDVFGEGEAEGGGDN